MAVNNNLILEMLSNAKFSYYRVNFNGKSGSIILTFCHSQN